MIDLIRLDYIYGIIAICSTILFIIKLIIFTFVGGDIEVETDFNDISDCDTSFNFLSIQSMLSFFMGFGWMGLVTLTQLKTNIVLSLVLSIAIGAVFMFMSAYLMFIIKKFNKQVKVNLEDYIGTEGKAYTDINSKSEGQIEITINNKREIRKAFNISDEKISAFTPIKIEKVENGNIYINKL